MRSGFFGVVSHNKSVSPYVTCCHSAGAKVFQSQRPFGNTTIYVSDARYLRRLFSMGPCVLPTSSVPREIVSLNSWLTGLICFLVSARRKAQFCQWVPISAK